MGWCGFQLATAVAVYQVSPAVYVGDALALCFSITVREEGVRWAVCGSHPCGRCASKFGEVPKGGVAIHRMVWFKFWHEVLVSRGSGSEGVTG